jgi:putative selenium metabolism hydrolase
LNESGTQLLTPEVQQELIDFARSLVRIKSYPGQEEEAIRFVEHRMVHLGYEDVTVDAMGNVVGRIGSGGRSVLFDSHVDTVEVNDEEAWAFPPFGGEIAGGRLHGRGSVDMKSAAAASVYAGVLARGLGLAESKTVYVSCTVLEEDCDGENLKHLLTELRLRPDFAVICEPSNNEIMLGHKGKAQIAVKTHGVSAHGAAPEKGVNAIYEMAEIIERVEQTNQALMQRDKPRPTLVMARISSTSASLNAVPSECEAYLDRRMVPGESEEDIRQEMDRLIAGKRANWQVGVLERTSWTGLPIRYEPFHLAWKIDPGHELAHACIAAYREYFGSEPREFGFWDFSTNAVTPVSLGIPTIGFGPGDYRLAHMRDESCEVQQIVDACGFYTRLIGSL